MDSKARCLAGAEIHTVCGHGVSVAAQRNGCGAVPENGVVPGCAGFIIQPVKVALAAAAADVPIGHKRGDKDDAAEHRGLLQNPFLGRGEGPEPTVRGSSQSHKVRVGADTGAGAGVEHLTPGTATGDHRIGIRIQQIRHRQLQGAAVTMVVIVAVITRQRVFFVEERVFHAEQVLGVCIDFVVIAHVPARAPVQPQIAQVVFAERHRGGNGPGGIEQGGKEPWVGTVQGVVRVVGHIAAIVEAAGVGPGDGDLVDLALPGAPQEIGFPEIDGIHIEVQVLVNGDRGIHKRIGLPGLKEPVITAGAIGVACQQIHHKDMAFLGAGPIVVAGAGAENSKPVIAHPNNGRNRRGHFQVRVGFFPEQLGASRFRDVHAYVARIEVPDFCGAHGVVVVKVILNLDVFAPHVQAHQEDGAPVWVCIRIGVVDIIIKYLGIEHLGLQVHVVDMGVIRQRQPLEMGQECLGDVGPQFIPDPLSGPGRLDVLPIIPVILPGREGVEHAVVGAHVNHGFPVPVCVKIILIGSVTVEDVEVVRRLGNGNRGGMDDVSQFPLRAVDDPRSQARDVLSPDVMDKVGHPVVMGGSQVAPRRVIPDTQVRFDGSDPAAFKGHELPARVQGIIGGFIHHAVAVFVHIGEDVPVGRGSRSQPASSLPEGVDFVKGQDLIGIRGYIRIGGGAAHIESLDFRIP